MTISSNGTSTASQYLSPSSTDTVTNKTISGSSNTLTNIANSSLTNSSVTIGSTSVSLGATAATLTGLTLTSPTLTTPTLSLSTSSNVSDGRIAWDSTNKKIQVGNGTAVLDITPSTVSVVTPSLTSNNYTLVITDKDKFLQIANPSGPAIVYVPTNSVAFPVGTQITVIQSDSGQVTFAPVSSGTTTINATPGLKLRAQWSIAVLTKIATEVWVVNGDLSA